MIDPQVIAAALIAREEMPAEKGDPGLMGPRGPQGNEGPEGPQGAPGPIGANGPVGADGPEGPQGPKGDTGPKGPKGDKGDKGNPGIQGPAGIGGRGIFPRGGLNSGMVVADEGVRINGGTVVGEIDFAGAGVSVAMSGSKAVATITGGGSGVTVKDEGVSQGVADTLDFTGSGVTATIVGSTATVAITGSGAPTTSDYLVGTADAGLSNEIVVGTSPGGELGGTWGSPTVDATHSGSSHAGLAGQPGSTDVAVADGGTGASTASGARTNLGLVIGTDVAAPSAIPAFATPAIVLGTAAAAGAASTVIRSDSTIVAFDATVPVTQAFADAAAAGSATVAARRDHKHGMPSERAAASTTPAAVGTAAVGTGVTDARSDHVHATGAGTPSTQAFGDSAATGTGPAAAMTDHKHAMPANPTTGLVSSVEFVIDGGGSTITTGVKGDLELPFAGTITAARLFADQSGSIVVNVWKDTYANYPPTVADKITASAPPTISTATKSQDTTLTGWTTSFSAGDTLRFNVDSVTTIQRVTLSLTVTRS